MEGDSQSRQCFKCNVVSCISSSPELDGEVAVDVLYVPHLMCVLLVHVLIHTYVRTYLGWTFHMCTICRLEIDIGVKFKILIGKHVDSTKGYEAMLNTHIRTYVRTNVRMFVSVQGSHKTIILCTFIYVYIRMYVYICMYMDMFT